MVHSNTGKELNVHDNTWTEIWVLTMQGNSILVHGKMGKELWVHDNTEKVIWVHSNTGTNMLVHGSTSTEEYDMITHGKKYGTWQHRERCTGAW